MVDLYKYSYSLVDDLLSDIKKPFSKVCIHGQISSLYLPRLYEIMKVKNNGE
jgi:hypothetical protein